MAKRIVPLSDIQIKSAKPKEKLYKLMDGCGLFLLVTPEGGKLWRFDYRFSDKRTTMALGKYPDISLSEARSLCDNARQMISQGMDPSTVRKEEKSRDKAIHLDAQSLPLPSIRILMDGVIEIWKGRNVMRLTSDEATFITGKISKIVR